MFATANHWRRREKTLWGNIPLISCCVDPLDRILPPMGTGDVIANSYIGNKFK